ncbi:phage regulatory CII family protein [Variovorax paradoxus]|uniref:phage regulatory CII family protein n=1 Tax=Variovorax paradoxus TaxID=34073 RepID=UPI001933EC0D|nr:hypothetical protein INQ48_20575 [Variovorax paradoxus]
MTPNDALRLMVKQFPGGIEVVASRIDKPEETLRKELSGTDAKFKLGMVTALLISDMCIEAGSPDCYAFINAINGKGARLLELPLIDPSMLGDLRISGATIVEKGANAFKVLSEALQDGHVSDNERKAIEAAMVGLVGAAQGVVRGAQANNEAGKPAHLRAA